MAEIGGELASGLVAVGGFFGGGFENDGFEVGGDGGVELARRGGVVVRELLEERLAVVGGEGGTAGEQLVERDAERVDVGAVVEDGRAGLRLAPGDM